MHYTMAIVPAPVFQKFREQIEEPFSGVLDSFVSTINDNFQNPSFPTGIGLTVIDDFPPPMREEFQQLQAALNRAFLNIANSQLAAPVALVFREQLPSQLGDEMESLVGMINVGLRNLFP